MWLESAITEVKISERYHYNTLLGMQLFLNTLLRHLKNDIFFGFIRKLQLWIKYSRLDCIEYT
jgi:hypothetical protein